MLEANAYNTSIYWMVATPYALVGGLGLAFFGLVWKARRSQASQSPPAAPGGPETGTKEEPRP